MGMFDRVTFGPEDVKAVSEGKGTRGQIIALLTSQTCGEPCWHAREEVCRCSCGGKNHGCLNRGEARPERHAKIGGVAYRLEGVGPRGSLCESAERINKAAGFRYVDKPTVVIEGMGANYTQEDARAAKAQGKEVWYSQYYGTWSETDDGAPARLKYPSPSQKKWVELAAFDGQADIALLWVRCEMPPRPTELKVDRQGQPLANQNPQ
jgi:hypothetical protein